MSSDGLPVPTWLRRRVGELDPDALRGAIGRVNSEPWEGYAAGSARLVNLDVERARDGGAGWVITCAVLPADPSRWLADDQYAFADFNAALGQGWEEVAADG